jgi:ADP-heptose:LPS heptosyltransferase
VSLLEHLGDIVACEPITRFLRRENPDASIIWLVKKEYRELIDSNPFIDKTVVVHCLTERMMLWESGVFDHVIDLHFPDRYCSLCRRPLKKPKGASDVNLTNYFHFGSLLSSMAQGVGLPLLDDQPVVHIPESAVRKVDSLPLPKEFVVINCTSNAPEKGWPSDKWVRLLAEMKEAFGLSVFEVGTKTFLDGSLALSQSLCGKLSILESAEVIRRANLFIGIDSGPAHLANAAGVYGVILMGSYLGFDKYNPFSGAYRSGQNAEIIYESGSVADISVDRVFQSIVRVSERMMTGTSHAV